MTSKPSIPASFKDFALIEPLQRALDEVGYEVPTPIQILMIPVVLSGKDVLGQAQTGTGKTAAFALPLLSNIDLRKAEPQVLVLAPTRELAIQVAEAFQKYGAHLPGLKVLAVYGGQEYGPQLRALHRGVHVVVGTPGRVMDHIDRKTLKLEAIKCLVLDEADEMLKMGFKEDVEWVLDHTPEQIQIALFSATLPAAIREIARKYLKDPEEIIIRNKTSTVELTRQRYWLVSRLNKLDALSRILEVEPFDAVLIFVRTKSATLDVADQLEARGFAVAPLNGDIVQAQRERTVEQLKSGRLNILIATDVAARGLDVDRISHVINYDIPHDTEAYIHRIGRTGRAGRKGEAILFVAPREQRMLQSIERATRQKIEPMEVPSIAAINAVRIARFKKQISDALAKEEWKTLRETMTTFSKDNSVDPIDVAAALATMCHGDRPFLLQATPEKPGRSFEAFSRKAQESLPTREEVRHRRPTEAPERPRRSEEKPRSDRPANAFSAYASKGDDAPHRGETPSRGDTAPEADTVIDTDADAADGRSLATHEPAPVTKKSPPPYSREDRKRDGEGKPHTHEREHKRERPERERPEREKDSRSARPKRDDSGQEEGKIKYRIEVGRFHGVGPGQIMGAIAGESGIDGRTIGRINLYEEFSTVDLPDTMDEAEIKKLKRVRVVGRVLMITRFDPNREGQEETKSAKPRARAEKADSKPSRYRAREGKEEVKARPRTRESFAKGKYPSRRDRGSPAKESS